MISAATASLTIWNESAVCFFLSSAPSEVLLIKMLKLSPKTVVRSFMGMSRDRSMYRSDMLSLVAVRMALNSALYVDVSTVDCHLLIQETGVHPTNAMHPVMEQPVFLSFA